MKEPYISLQEAANILGKSTQTVRRMIKRNEIPSQQVKTPQGYQYVIPREALGFEPEEMLSESTIQTPIQHVILPQLDEPKINPPIQNEVLINQHRFEELMEANLAALDKLSKIHEEKAYLYRLIERLQAELDREVRRPRTFFSAVMDWIFKK